MSEKEELEILRKVAFHAAFCMIDLNSNLRDAHTDYMSGKMPKGAYEYVLSRHGIMLSLLNDAGFTQRNPFLDIPMNPNIKY